MCNHKQIPLRNVIVLLAASLVFLKPTLSGGGTLDDAPFSIAVDRVAWQIEDSTAQPMGKDVFLVATISKTKTSLKSVVIKTILNRQSSSSLEELCSGIRDSFANPTVKKLSETDTMFLGHKAKAFSYEITNAGQTTHNEATVFISGGQGWTIACVGPANQKDEIKKIIGIYHKKGA